MMEEAEAVRMVCPDCRVDLVMAERHGVQIDYCPKCRGVWLDRDELDKIVEKAVARGLSGILCAGP
jgi:Zn-finger nucleic acid-binding protein